MTATNDIATWVIDPEYQGNARGRTAYGSHAPLDYAELATWCRDRRGQVIVHEQQGATWLPFTLLSEQARTGRINDGAVKRRAEVVWLSDE
jgi:hypothetical protein